MDIPKIKKQVPALWNLRKVRSNHLNRNTDRSGKGGFSRGKTQRSGIPLAAIGRKISPLELVSEKLEKQERKKAEKAVKKQAAVSKKVSAEDAGKQGNPPRQANVQRAPQKDKHQRAKTPVKIIPLGGLGEIGNNMTVIECANDMFIIDCGLAFPDADMLGVDLVIPDFTYIERNADKLRGIVLTHGHEDHIGGLAYLLKKVNTPVYGTRLTLALVEAKLKEHQLSGKVELNVVAPRKTIRMGCMAVELIHVNHSIPDAVGLAIHTPAGVLVHTGDFKVDYSPIDGGIIDLGRFGELGGRGVLALMADSTNAERPGYTPTERKVGVSFDKLFAEAEGKRIIIATFSSNIHRVQQIINCAERCGRKVAVFGRSMVNVITIARELGYLDVKDNTIIDIDLMNRYSAEQIVLITTGSQGEPMSALTRMAMGDHKKVNITPQDFIIISATPIPGNEKLVGRVINDLMHLGADVIYERSAGIHVSGHGCQEEIKTIMGLTKPKYFIPVHGEYRMLVKHAELGRMLGVQPKNIIISENGKVIELSKKSIKTVDTVPAGAVLVDAGLGEVGDVVMRDRHRLAEDGMIVVVLPYSSYDYTLLGEPEIVTRGFIYVKEAEDLMTELKRVVMETVTACDMQKITDWTTIKSKVKNNLSGYLYKTTRRSPMILPVITEI
jgi:ribonuclease J